MNTDSKTAQYEVHTRDHGHIASFRYARHAAKFIQHNFGVIKRGGVVLYAEGQTTEELCKRLVEFGCDFGPGGFTGFLTGAWTKGARIYAEDRNLDFIVDVCLLVERTMARKARTQAKIKGMLGGMTETWTTTSK